MFTPLHLAEVVHQRSMAASFPTLYPAQRVSLVSPQYGLESGCFHPRPPPAATHTHTNKKQRSETSLSLGFPLVKWVVRLSPQVCTEGEEVWKYRFEGVSRAQALCPSLCLLDANTDPSPVCPEGPPEHTCNPSESRGEPRGQASPGRLGGRSLLKCHTVTVVSCGHFLEKHYFEVSLNPTIKGGGQQLPQSPESVTPSGQGRSSPAFNSCV